MVQWLTQEAGPVPINLLWPERTVGHIHGRCEKSRCAWFRAPLSWQTGVGIRIAGFWRFGISLSPAYFLKLPSCYHQVCLLDSPRDDKDLAGKQSKLSKAIKKQRVIVPVPSCSL